MKLVLDLAPASADVDEVLVEAWAQILEAELEQRARGFTSSRARNRSLEAPRDPAPADRDQPGAEVREVHADDPTLTRANQVLGAELAAVDRVAHEVCRDIHPGRNLTGRQRPLPRAERRTPATHRRL